MNLRYSTTLNLAISILDHSSLTICLPPINCKRTVGEYRAADTDGEIMFRTFFSLALKRCRWMVMLAAFAVSFGALNVFAIGWAAAIIPIISETALNAILAALIAQFAMSLTGAVLSRHQSRENE